MYGSASFFASVSNIVDEFCEIDTKKRQISRFLWV